MIDNEDLSILKELKRDSRQTTRDIGRILEVSSTTIHRRLNNLIKNGYIKQFTIVPDWNKLERETLAFIMISVDYDHIKKKKAQQAEIAEKLRKHPFVFDAATITGSKDLLIKVRAKDTKELDQFINYLRKVPGIHRTETLVVLHEATRYDNPFDKPYF